MSNFFTLLKINLNLNFGISALKYRFTKERKKRWEPILIGVGVILGFGPLLIFYSLLMFGVYKGGESLGQPEMVLTVAFVVGQFLVLMFGIFYIMGAFYFSKDLDILIPLPLKPYEVLGSKFLVVMLNEYLTLLPILLPAVIIYGAGMGKGILYWLKALVLVLLSPVIPLIAGGLFTIILMRFVNVRKSKDLLAIIGGLLGISFGLGINFFAQKIPEGNEQEFLNGLLNVQAGLVKAIGDKFPPALWATFGMAREDAVGLSYFALFIAVSILLFGVLLWLGNRIFYKSLLAGQEISRRRKVLTGEEMNRRYGKSLNPVSAIFRREWRLLLRTPVYVLNGLTGAVIGPLMLFFMVLFKGNNEQSRLITAFLQDPENILLISLIGLGIILFSAGMNIVASTAVSREGQTFWIAKMIPVSPRLQVLAKFWNAFSVSAISMLITVVLLGVTVKFSVLRLAALLVLGSIGSALLLALSLLLDVLRPKLVWNSPTEAMKQNINGILGILASLLVIALLAAAAAGMVLMGLPEWAIYAVLAVLMGVPCAICMAALLALADRQYAKLEV